MANQDLRRTTIFKLHKHPTIFELAVTYTLKSNNVKKRKHKCTICYTTILKERDKWMKIDYDSCVKLVEKKMTAIGTPLKSKIEFAQPVFIDHDNECVESFLKDIL